MTTKYTALEILEEMRINIEFATRISTGLKNGTLDLYGDSESDEGSIAFDLIADICEDVRANKWRVLSTEQRIDTLLSIFETFPHYTSSSHLFLTIWRDGDLTEEAKAKLWDGIVRQLSNKNENVRKAMEYVLWVDFFENQKTCKEAWLALTSRASDPFVLDRLLVIGGPVPYEIKQPIYEQYAKEPHKHAVLARSLAHSISDVHGKIDKTDAKKYLAKLKLPHNDDYYKFLLERL